jgi:hypothetical protein
MLEEFEDNQSGNQGSHTVCIECCGLKHRGYHVILISGQCTNTAFNLLGSTYDSTQFVVVTVC